MNHVTRLLVLAFLLFSGQRALANPPVAPDSATSLSIFMYRWGVAEGKAYAVLISNSILSASEKTTRHIASQDDAKQNMKEAIIAENSAQIEFWEGYYRGLGEIQASSQLANQKTSAKRSQPFVTGSSTPSQ